LRRTDVKPLPLRLFNAVESAQRRRSLGKGIMIIRRRYNRDYAVIPNHITNDPGLKAETLGVLVYLLSRPPDWLVYATQLCTRFDCGRERIYRIINELTDLGYVRRERRRHAETMQFGEVEYVVYDDPKSPDITAVEPQSEKPTMAMEPQSEKPDTGKPDTAFPTLLSKDTNQVRIGNKNLPAVLGSRFEEFWSLCPKKVDKIKAELAYNRVLKRKLAGETTLIEAMRRYGIEREGQDPQYTKHPSTWLNGGSWGNGPVATGTKSGRGSLDELAERLRNGPPTKPSDSASLELFPSR
jgi:hypothetical protein